MHDTVELERRGVPSVFVASSTFIDAAQFQAQALGLSTVPRVIVPHPIQDATDEEMGQKADASLDALLDALVRVGDA